MNPATSAATEREETGSEVIAELSLQHDRVSRLLRILDGGRWWSQSQPSDHAADVRKQVLCIRDALDKIELSVAAMEGR